MGLGKTYLMSSDPKRFHSPSLSRTPRSLLLFHTLRLFLPSSIQLINLYVCVCCRAVKWYAIAIEKIGGLMAKLDEVPRLPPLPIDTKEEREEYMRAKEAKDSAANAWKEYALSLYYLVFPTIHGENFQKCLISPDCFLNIQFLSN
jgi:hypothetical protein